MNGVRLSIAVLLVTAKAAAEPAPPPASSQPSNGEAREKPALIPAASDTLGGHLLVGAGANVVVPFGELDSDTDLADRAGAGLGFAADAGIGVGRNLVLGAWFQYSRFSEPSGCSGCRTSSLAVGPFIRYHLVQGVRFDPWVSLGLGYRKLETEDALSTSSYSGVEWLKLAVGGDWYALSQFAFGPYMELGLGSFTDHPGDRDTAIHASFTVGLRLGLDAPGK